MTDGISADIRLHVLRAYVYGPIEIHPIMRYVRTDEVKLDRLV
jgi:hypothetical protein